MLLNGLRRIVRLWEFRFLTLLRFSTFYISISLSFYQQTRFVRSKMIFNIESSMRTNNYVSIFYWNLGYLLTVEKYNCVENERKNITRLRIETLWIYYITIVATIYWVLLPSLRFEGVFGRRRSRFRSPRRWRARSYPRCSWSIAGKETNVSPFYFSPDTTVVPAAFTRETSRIEYILAAGSYGDRWQRWPMKYEKSRINRIEIVCLSWSFDG